MSTIYNINGCVSFLINPLDIIVIGDNKQSSPH